MALKRMFSLSIIDTDKFLEMPVSAQNLYFHLGMRADDDGFVASPKKVMRDASSSGDDMKILISKGYVIPFESGICVITDWLQNNNIRPDRYNPTLHIDEKSMLLTLENGSYCIDELRFPQYVEQCNYLGIPSDNQRYTNGTRSIGKVRLGKISIDKDICARKRHEETFKEFWSAYPKKRSKNNALNAWLKLKPDTDLFGRIMDSIAVFKNSHDWSKNNGQYIPYPATWLNAGGWEDEAPKIEIDHEADEIKRRAL